MSLEPVGGGASSIYPTKRLLLSVVGTAAALFVLWLMLGFGSGVAPEVVRGGVLGLLAATVSHILGTLAGERFASGGASGNPSTNAAMSAYLASSALRFICTPLFAVSLYFALPQAPAPLLIGAAAGHALIMIADVAVLLKAVGGAGSRRTPSA